jgi:hypothetical protein
MSEIAKFAGANLPAVTSLTAALRSLEVAAPSATAGGSSPGSVAGARRALGCRSAP